MPPDNRRAHHVVKPSRAGKPPRRSQKLWPHAESAYMQGNHGHAVCPLRLQPLTSARPPQRACPAATRLGLELQSRPRCPRCQAQVGTGRQGGRACINQAGGCRISLRCGAQADAACHSQSLPATWAHCSTLAPCLLQAPKGRPGARRLWPRSPSTARPHGLARSSRSCQTDPMDQSALTAVHACQRRASTFRGWPLLVNCP